MRKGTAVQLERIAKAVATFVAKDAVKKSIDLQLGKAYASEWQAVSLAVGARGYATEREVADHLMRLFGFYVEKESMNHARGIR